MSDTPYNNVQLLLATGALDLATADLRVLLVDSSYAFDAGHAYVSDLSGELAGGGYARVVLTGKTVALDAPDDSVAFDADDASFLALGAVAGTPAAAVVFKQVTNDADSPLVSFHALTDGLVPTGADYIVQWDAGGILRLNRGVDMDGGKYLSGQRLTIGAVSNILGSALAAGKYLLTPTTNCYWAQGDNAVVAGAAVDGSGYLLAGEPVLITVDDAASGYVAVIQEAAAGVLYIQKRT